MLTQTLGPDDTIIDCALNFAADRLERGAAIAARIPDSDNPRHIEIRKAFAVKALQSAITQIEAAIVLVEMES